MKPSFYQEYLQYMADELAAALDLCGLDTAEQDRLRKYYQPMTELELDRWLSHKSDAEQTLFKQRIRAGFEVTIASELKSSEKQTNEYLEKILATKGRGPKPSRRESDPRGPAPARD